MSKVEKDGLDRSSQDAETTSTDGCQGPTPITRWPWPAQFVLALSIITAVVVLLVGLPAISMLVVEKTFAGLSEGSFPGAMTFWGALFAAFISLVVLFIGAVFAFTAFKVESGAKQEAQKAAKKGIKELFKEKVQGIVIGLTKQYIREDIEIESGEKKTKPRGDVMTRHAADDYIRESNSEDEPSRGDRITRDSADDYINSKGPVITEKVAITFVDNHGEGITRDRVDTYIREDIESDGKKQSRGEKLARQVVDDYVRSVIDNYANEDIEGEDVSRVEKMTRDLVKAIGADEIARRVDERLASLGLADMLRLRFRRRGPGDGPGSAGQGRH